LEIPNVANVSQGEKLSDFPSFKPSKSDLLTPAVNTGAKLYTPIASGGTTYLVDSEKTYVTGNIGNTSLKKIRKVVYLPSSHREICIKRWRKKYKHIPSKINTLDIIESVENSTCKMYFRKIAHLEKYWKKSIPHFCRQYSLEELLTHKLTFHWVRDFLFQKSNKGIALSTLHGYTTALNFMRKILDAPLLPETTLLSTTKKTIAKKKSKKPVGTRAIPLKLLRLFLHFLRSQGARTFTFFYLSYWAGMRANEAVSITTKSFKFHTNQFGKKCVTLTILRPKTKKRYLDDSHTVTFPLSSGFYKNCPYKMAHWFCKNYPPGTPLVPLKGLTSISRQNKMYPWFNNLKKGFENWYSDHFGDTIDTSSWQFHSLRTSLIGNLRVAGMDWEKIQVRVGHKIDSKTTRETYYLNALMTKDFDKTFEKILQKDENLRSLMEIDSTPKEDTPESEIYSPPPLEPVPTTPPRGLSPRTRKLRKMRRRYIRWDYSKQKKFPKLNQSNSLQTYHKIRRDKF